MAVLKPRNRILIFRLTQDEYDQLQSACSIGGARSLSDFARSRLLSSLAVDGSPASSLTSFEARLAELQSVVQRLARLIEQS